MQNQTEPHFEVAIIGAGFSGLGMAMALKQDGIEDFVVLERAADLGGTWRDNSYPGCACDIPSVLYSRSDEQNPEWSRLFAPPTRDPRIHEGGRRAPRHRQPPAVQHRRPERPVGRRALGDRDKPGHHADR